jgi:hypothetical protein
LSITAYGYARSHWSKDGPTELAEVTFQATPLELRQIAQHLLRCADALEADTDFDHEHLCEPTGADFEGADVIVAK